MLLRSGRRGCPSLSRTIHPRRPVLPTATPSPRGCYGPPFDFFPECLPARARSRAGSWSAPRLGCGGARSTGERGSQAFKRLHRRLLYGLPHGSLLFASQGGRAHGATDGRRGNSAGDEGLKTNPLSYGAEAGRAPGRKPSRLSWPQAARMSWPREIRMNAGTRRSVRICWNASTRAKGGER
jgi:hypothetical protein